SSAPRNAGTARRRRHRLLVLVERVPVCADPDELAERADVPRRGPGPGDPVRDHLERHGRGRDHRDASAARAHGAGAPPRRHRAHVWRRPRKVASALSARRDRKSTRLNSSHLVISYAVFCLKKKNKNKKYLLIHKFRKTSLYYNARKS